MRPSKNNAHCLTKPCRRLRKALSGLAIAITLAGGPALRDACALDRTQTAYLTHCGGCHGIEGKSRPSFVPSLRDAVGVFTCTPEGRAYLVRVPGVSMSLIRDDALLADVMNFVVFRLGGKSTPSGVAPYTAGEVHALREHPVESTDLLTFRGQILGRALPKCPPAG
ncbi:cytochrome c class I [Acetobacter nitrogenifigens DSM 23921 = NBRC 105050]|uniref:Cytochrome c domain-containing protein n=1 Tax=Acetobacter nitrogenifigens DSM 23921 = NBRC 105050 TaxID=1120919 RepID=A0A511X7H4_9PROT|nr:cystathionine beta-lyase [Acetobacter nitrogenifigens]GBQ95608.1 cytochrome c class I [Acetobacter nitrogenifigens DSM 23921 = NBRC 105050]GEN58875.1 hypothetical protein ANI02nite_07590 [Acetobacter nitrogenifigens DSM 23921 = NBRC 105050]